MTLLFVDGFDAQDLAAKGWSGTGSSWVTDTATPYSSGSSLRGNRGSVLSLVKAITASAQPTIGFAFAANGLSATQELVAVLADSGVTTHLLLTVGTTGVLSLCRGTSATVLASSSVGAVPINGSFCVIEIQCTIADTGGTCIVKVNGTTVINFTGDTRNAGTSTNVDTLRLRNPSGGSTTTESFWFDDLYVLNSSGSVNTTFLGSWRVQTVFPNAAGSSTQFTPVSGANYTNVNDVPDNTASYVSDNVSGHRDTYTMDDVTAGTDTIYGIQQVMHAWAPEAGVATTIKQAQKSGATVSYGATKSLGPSMTGYMDIFETNPATSAAYTQSEANALEAGFEIV